MDFLCRFLVQKLIAPWSVFAGSCTFVFWDNVAIAKFRWEGIGCIIWFWRVNFGNIAIIINICFCIAVVDIYHVLFLSFP